MIQELGVQLFTIRDYMTTPEDVRNSFKKLRELGYTVAQTARCAIGYELFGQIAREEGITICGTHDRPVEQALENPQQAIADHRLLDTHIMGVGGAVMNSVEDIQAYIDRVNRLADVIYPQGFKFSYHNHSHEFRKFDGKTVMQWFLEGMDPEKTSFCLDTYWVQYGGGDVCGWIEKLAGRIDILHLKDMGMRTNEERRHEPFITEIGNGNLDFDKIMEAAEKIGVKYYVVEQDYCPGDPFESLKMSSDFIHAHYM